MITDTHLNYLLTNKRVDIDLSKYPSIVQNNVIVVDDGPYCGWCYHTQYLTVVTTSSLSHEMGHASANLLGIEKELGTLVLNTRGAKSITNENLFCYGAQLLNQGYKDDALAEYAADAIQAYTEDLPELPKEIKNYINSKWS